MTALHLAGGDWAATLLPDQGAAFARLTHAGQDVLLPLPAGADPNRARAGAFWMIPWANRIGSGQVAPTLRVPVNLPAEDNAIHGLSREHPWQVLAADGRHATLEQRLSAAGYAYTARLDIGLDDRGLHLSLRVENTGEARPFGLGWHPWFARHPGQHLRFAARHRLTVDARMLPVAAQPCPGIAAPVEALAGTDAHFAGWAGRAELTAAAPGHALLLRAEGAWAANLQLYVPRDRPALCLEPSSHIPDAPNQPALAGLGAMPRLAPGAALDAALSLTTLAGR